jgi:type VI secretion system secreted protein VgrG
MAEYTQANRPMEVITPLGKDVLLITSFIAQEGLNQLFKMHLGVLALKEREVCFDKLLGQKITVRMEMPGKKQRFWNGYCIRVGQGESSKVFTRYELELAPELWFATKKSQSRIFQHLKVEDILKKVLAGYKVEWGLTGKYEKRDYCVQYRETDFNFASRLMEEEGIYYYFKHENGNHTLVVADNSGKHEAVAGTTTVEYRNISGQANLTDDVIYDWSKTQELASGKFVLWDHCFEMPHKHLECEKTITPSVNIGGATHKLNVNNDKLEVYDWPGEYAQRFDGIDKSGGEQPAELQKIFQENKRTIDLRMQAEASQSLSVVGASSCRGFTSGHKFSIKTLASDQLTKNSKADGEYVLTSITHTATETGYETDGGMFSYSNNFSCIPSALPYRPARVTPKPVIPGSQTAVVVGPAGQEIFTDKYGRIKAQFHWDREGQNNADSSCWIRVGTPWAGKQWGMMHIPRIGQEVLVQFEEGDPDRPIVVGSVWNADQMPAYKLPDEKTKSYIKTNTSLGGVGYNEIRFEDLKGKEQIYIHGERNLDIRIRNEAMEIINNHRHLIVGGTDATSGKKEIRADQREQVWQDKHLNIKQNQEEHIEGSMKLTIGHGKADNPGNLDIMIEKIKKELIGEDNHLHVKKNMNVLVDKVMSLIFGDLKIGVGGATGVEVKKDQQTKIGGSQSLNVTGDRKGKIGGGDHLTVGGDCNQKISGGFSQDVSMAINQKAGTSLAVEAGTTIHVKAGAAMVLEAGAQLSLKVGGSFVDINPGGVFISGPMVMINSGGSAGSGAGCSPAAPQSPAPPAEPTKAQDAVKAAPIVPTVADSSKTGFKSCP